MRVTANTLHDRLLTELNRLSSEQARLTRQMSTGKKIQEASEDPALAARVIGYSTEKRMLQQFDRNADRVSQGLAVGATHLDAMQKIAAQAINLAPSTSVSGDPGQRTVLVRQIDSLVEQAAGLAIGSHNNNHLFGAASSDAPPFTFSRDSQGRVAAAVYVGDPGASPAVNVGEGARVATGTSGSENAQIAAFINNLVALRDAVEAGDETLIGAAQRGVSDSRDELVGMQVTLVSNQSRVELHRVQNKSRFSELAGLSAKETDADLAETILRFQEVERNYQAALEAGSRIMQQSLLDFLR